MSTSISPYSESIWQEKREVTNDYDKITEKSIEIPSWYRRCLSKRADAQRRDYCNTTKHVH